MVGEKATQRDYNSMAEGCSIIQTPQTSVGTLNLHPQTIKAEMNPELLKLNMTSDLCSPTALDFRLWTLLVPGVQKKKDKEFKFFLLISAGKAAILEINCDLVGCAST